MMFAIPDGPAMMKLTARPAMAPERAGLAATRAAARLMAEGG